MVIDVVAWMPSSAKRGASIVVFDDYVRLGVPLVIPLLMALFSSIAALAGDAKRILESQDSATRAAEARRVIKRKLPVGLCLSAISFDIWAITTLQSADEKTLRFYSLYNHRYAIAPLLIVHLISYLFALLWDGIDQGSNTLPEYIGAAVSIICCVGILTT
jgi:hypothetical protein